MTKPALQNIYNYFFNLRQSEKKTFYFLYVTSSLKLTTTLYKLNKLNNYLSEEVSICSATLY